MDLSEPRAFVQRALRPLAGWPTRGAVLRDVLFGAAITALCLVEVLFRWASGHLPADEALATAVASAALTALVVVLGRLYPLLSLVVALLGSFWVYGFSVLVLCVAYLVGRRMPDVWSAVALFVSGTVLWLAAAVLTRPDDVMVWTTTVSTMVFSVVLPWLVGVYRRQHVALATAGWEHARQLQREHRLTVDQVRLRERSRIAQDMHDSLGHELSLIALRAGALEVTPDLAEEHRRSAAELRATAVTATQHLREIIGVLRTEAEPVPMSPADEGVAALVGRVRDSGMRVALVRDGDTAGLPSMVDRAVHRVVQESLTNAAKYAPGSEVTVWLTANGERVEVRVVNSAPRGRRPKAEEGGRRGLIGLRERVRLTGGSFAAGPDGGGGWEVCAVMPLDGTVEAGPSTEGGAEIDQLQSAARRRVRGWSLALVLLPVMAAVTVGLVLGWITAGNMEETALAPEEFAALRVGDSQAEVEEVLPAASMYVDARMLEEDAVPPGATCSYYRSDTGLFAAETVLYQVCFAEGRLLTKGEAPLR
ncbi:two-component sensor histidine kinase [Nocardiopsis sp. TSRI0078]|uniref:sensor histidine kinase n=1 Tax=unclassified Nocardiopsis TaxID=2649073 RepID=UPI00093BE657|nr:histidine kinase [Nocardiopsis sp. TSRI0078]OKI18799.1 two-component sensor histidine kinase [Nocardiopsis sp. TSRI0078]